MYCHLNQFYKTCFWGHGLQNFLNMSSYTDFLKKAFRLGCNFILLLICFLNANELRAQDPSPFVINEFMASNSLTLKDENSEFSDWIEILNITTNSANLGGYFLTDDPARLTQWVFPSVNIPRGGYLVVFASGKNRTNNPARLHTSFSLKSEGEYLALVQPDGTSIASVLEPEYPEQFRDVSYGLDDTGANYLYFTKATPGATNGAGLLSFVEKIKLSVDHGFYDQPFDLTLSTETTNAIIRYTTNGLTPTVNGGMQYSNTLRISRTTVLRAAAFRTGYKPSAVETVSYLFLDDVIRQASDGKAPAGWPTTWGGNTVDYGMDPDVVNNVTYAGTIKNDLKTLPSFSLVLPTSSLFDASTGIYANPGQDGRAWERPCSLELIHPDGTKGFQIDAGIRIRGGFSRSTGNPKHALRFFFRSDYGTSKLRYPLFGKQATDTFDAFDLRTFQNYSWSFQGDSSGIFMRDVFSRDAQLAMGHQGERGDYYHLYINGLYWGLFNTAERPEASYGATYFGGSKTNFDVIKVEAGPYTINATDGTLVEWTKLYTLAKAGFTSDAAYLKVQGLNPDRTPNPTYPNFVDIDNLIDYMLIIIYGGNIDAPISAFLGNTSPNNFYGMRDRTGASGGFRFFCHDAEHTLLPNSINEDRTGPWPAGESDIYKSNPQWVWQKLSANPEFRLRVADHVHKHFFNGGILTPASATALLMKRKNQIDRAVVGESARWGDAKTGTPYTRATWQNAVNNVVQNYLPRRSDIVLTQLKAKNLYPATVAPSFSVFGGNVLPGSSVSITAPAGILYVTQDGSDPRLFGGAVSPSVRPQSGPLVLNESLTAKARALVGTNWSALVEAPFTLIQTFTNLSITEIMYHPPDSGETNGSDLEFIEIKNVGTKELNLSGVTITNGIDYRFPIGTRLAPGKFTVLASDRGAFTNRYPQVVLSGVYDGNLANTGDTIEIRHAVGTLITKVTFIDETPWPGAADGRGFSLVPINPNLNPDANNVINWRTSSAIGGSPGKDDADPNVPTILITELLAHTDPPQLDTVEFFNPGTNSANISGWFLTDDRQQPKKFKLPPDSILSAGAYFSINESQFNTIEAGTNAFTFSSHGDEVYLYSADASGELTGFSDGFSFPASENGVSFGRHINSLGEIQYPPQKALTLGSANDGPKVGPVVINEIRFQPIPGENEFIELKNLTDQSINLYDPAFPTNRWRVEGVDFDFPSNASIPAKGLLVLTSSDPVAFRSRHAIPLSVPVFGLFSGTLQDSGELVQLLRPDQPDLDVNGLTVVPYLEVDAVRYNDKLPWPTNAAGFGPSLEKITPTAYGNDVNNWRASPGPASPGFENTGNRPPKVQVSPDQDLISATYPVTVNLSGTGSDDGQPNPPNVLTYQWSQISGPGVVVFASETALTTTAQLSGIGTYILRLTANDGEASAYSDMTISVNRPLGELKLTTSGLVWKFWDQGTNLGTNWSQIGFNDSAWLAGPSQLGYGDGDEITAVGFGANGSAKYWTTYFRRAIIIPMGTKIASATARLIRDDGAVVYIGGTEVWRNNMPETPIAFNTIATATVGGTDETTWIEQGIDASTLRPGTNIVAVEIHQSTASSSDISFDFELIAQVVSSNQPPIVAAGKNSTIMLPSDAVLTGQIIDDGLPILFTNLWTSVSGPELVEFLTPTRQQTIARFSAPGRYTLRLTARDGEFTVSDDLVVTVEPDQTYALWLATHFTPLELTNPEVSGDSADPDSDGHSNRAEFIAGTQPRDPQSFLGVLADRIVGGKVRFFVNVVANRTYTVESSETVRGPWSTLVELRPTQTGQSSVEDTRTNTSTRYYRVLTPAKIGF